MLTLKFDQFLDLVHPEYQSQFLECISKGNDIKVSIKIKAYTNNFDIRWIKINSRKLQYDNEESTILLCTNITDMQRDEQRLKRLSHSVEQSSVCHFITDTNGFLIYSNSKFLEVTGYSEKGLTGKNMSILKSGKTTEKKYKSFWTALLNGEQWKGEFYNKRKNGSFYWALTSVSPIKNEKGIITHFLGISEDITEKKIMIKQLIHSKSKAESADKLKTDFLSQISHEIRTPLNTLINYSAIIKNELGSKLTEELNWIIDGIEKSSKRLMRTTDLIIQISELTTKSYNLKMEKFDIYNRLIKTIYNEFRATHSSNKIEFKLEMAEDNYIIEGDINSITIILVQILENAFVYTEKGKILIKIYRNNNEKVSLEISDTGIGIDKKYLPKIYEPFSQEMTGYTRKYEGNGLGMTLVKGYAYLNNIRISIDSEKGKGTNITLNFPT